MAIGGRGASLSPKPQPEIPYDSDGLILSQISNKDGTTCNTSREVSKDCETSTGSAVGSSSRKHTVPETRRIKKEKCYQLLTNERMKFIALENEELNKVRLSEAKYRLEETKTKTEEASYSFQEAKNIKKMLLEETTFRMEEARLTLE
ncbi:uncharacterized protein LOC126265587 [Aethina tumida]|uniref:uncharacterized protein LOC126265587 n=1 Tax=Aethina tumida TaxID=116153 RepID=UPI0021488F82|nr:uncharacterized protein LOC126265587 [Aethina tumida]